MNTPFNALARWWRNWSSPRTGWVELACCGARETERIANDVGVSPSELRALAGKWPDSADLMKRRLAALDLDLAEITRTEPQVARDMQRVCTMCESGRECEHDLSRDPSDLGWRKYCPNAMTLDALAAERAKREKTT